MGAQRQEHAGPDRRSSGSTREHPGFGPELDHATAAHIHQGPAGQNGPVIITPIKDGGERLVGSGNTILTSAQFNAYRAGNLCVKVHSAANPGGETRAQLKL
ncbi:MAG TPA: CHRD domain-containing protein [Methylomirabilota bacterium]|nr:CHRD domain-containing protein [Methylomirabilota bacterium]